MHCEEKQFAGHRCLEVATEQLTCHVTLDAGPRVISLKRQQGAEMLYRIPPGEEAGVGGFSAIGGHRLWVAPETERTYFDDSGTVNWKQHDERLTFLPPPEIHADGAQIQKSLEFEEISGGVLQVAHCVKNNGNSPLKLAPWAITMVARGGVAILPMPEKAAHDMQHLLPQSQFALWSYTDFSDRRWNFLRDHVTLQHEEKPCGRFSMQKTGLYHPQGWVAYVLGSEAFIKVIAEGNSSAEYPDRGCNLETFTNPEFLEIETLGPLVTLSPKETTRHSEYWSVITITGSSDLKEIAQSLESHAVNVRQYVPSSVAESLR